MALIGCGVGTGVTGGRCREGTGCWMLLVSPRAFEVRLAILGLWTSGPQVHGSGSRPGGLGRLRRRRAEGGGGAGGAAGRRQRPPRGGAGAAKVRPRVCAGLTLAPALAPAAVLACPSACSEATTASKRYRCCCLSPPLTPTGLSSPRCCPTTWPLPVWRWSRRRPPPWQR